MPTVELPRKFFIKEREQAYSDWKTAFWRELIQNSVDAGSAVITITAESIFSVDDTRTVRVTFADDGCGMDRETLEAVYFRLGESTKDEDTLCAGGFGRARVLTCFSMKKYTIESGTLLVTGSGASYEIEDGFEPVVGCKLTIDVEDVYCDDFIDELELYLMQCELPNVAFTINGVAYAGGYSVGKHARNLVTDKRDMDNWFAEVYHETDGIPPQHLGLAIVRVNGLSMFMERHNGEGQLTIELKPEISRKILTANRDGFHCAYDQVWNAFRRELASETMSALKPKLPTLEKCLAGTGYNETGAPVSTKQTAYIPGTHTPAVVDQSFTAGLRRAIATKVEAAVARIKPNDRPAVDEPDFMHECTPKLAIEDYIPTFPVIVECQDAVTRQMALDFWEPGKWTFRMQDSYPIWLNCGPQMKTYLAWSEACKEAVRCYIAIAGIIGLRWTCGWYFGDQYEAKCYNVDAGHRFLLNPFGKSGHENRFNLSRKPDRQTLVSTAIHEVAHCMGEWHDERFANVMTRMVGEFKFSAVDKAIRGVW
jgi:hypothetical protein